MFDEDLRAICQKLKPLVGTRADALWIAYLTAQTPLAKRETEALIHMLAARYLSSQVDDHKILLPPPSPEAASGEFPLGKITYGRSESFPLYLRRENFIKHIGIFSITGGGKTNVAQILLLGLLEKNVPFLVLDWKRSYRALRALNRPNTQKLRVFTVGRKSASMFRWNPLRGPPGVHPKTWISVVAEALEKSHLFRPWSGRHLDRDSRQEIRGDRGIPRYSRQIPQLLRRTRGTRPRSIQGATYALAG
jgi:hypothetical protein